MIDFEKKIKSETYAKIVEKSKKLHQNLITWIDHPDISFFTNDFDKLTDNYKQALINTVLGRNQTEETHKLREQEEKEREKEFTRQLKLKLKNQKVNDKIAEKMAKKQINHKKREDKITIEKEDFLKKLPKLNI